MTPRFIPASLESISPSIGLEDAINQLAQGLRGNLSRRTNENDAFANPNGEGRQLRVGERLLSASDTAAIKRKLAPYGLADQAILNGLRLGSLEAYVQRADNHTIWRIPRPYFFHEKQDRLSNLSLQKWDPQSGEHPSMYDQPILLSQRQFHEWTDTHIETERIKSEKRSSADAREAQAIVGDQVRLKEWLDKPFWPWSLALAYSQPHEARARAVTAAVMVLDGYPRIGGSIAEHIAIAAVSSVYSAIFGESRKFDFQKLSGLEEPLLRAINNRAVSALGRRSLDTPPEVIELSAWYGAEIDSGRTSDLTKAGYREQFWDFLDDTKRVTFFYDVCFPRDEMIVAFGETGLSGPVDPAPTPERWSPEKMKAEIAACPIANREEAWRKVFKPQFAEHGWGNQAFRDFWSECRNTKGMTGRPAKRA